MKNTVCPWCFNVINAGKPGIEFPKNSGVFFCSKDCLDHAAVKVRGKKDIDLDKIKKHAQRIKVKQRTDSKSRLFALLIEKEKLDNEDLARLYSCLTSKQKLILCIAGLSNLSWAVHNEPKKLMAEIDSLVEASRK